MINTKGGVIVESVIMVKEVIESQKETRTAATVFVEDLKLMKAIARLKFDHDPMNNAWKEAVQLFNRENKHLLEEAHAKLDKNNSK